MNRSFFTSPILSVCLLVVFGYMAINVAQTAIGGRDTSGGKSDLVKEVDTLVQKKKRLEDELAWVKTEQYVEQEARNQLHLTKPNEIVVVYPAQQAVLGDSMQTQRKVEEHRDEWPGFVGEWLEIFGMPAR